MTMLPKVSPKLRILVVAEQTQQRLAFSDTIQSWGQELVACVASDQLTPEHFQQQVDVWLVDSEQDYAIIQACDNQAYHADIKARQMDSNGEDAALVDAAPSAKERKHGIGLLTTPSAAVLVGFLNAPYLNESQPYAKWQRQLKRKIAQHLNRPDLLADLNPPRGEVRDWQYVLLLGASMGGPLAVKEFLDNLPEDLPVAILLAQHFNEGMVNSLPRILNRHNQWRCDVIESTRQLLTGRCLIVPIQHAVVCDSTGRVILQPNRWEGAYQPCISRLLLNCSEAFGNELIHITFSGMGEDGSDVAAQAIQNGGRIWAQEPVTTTCASQPQNMINTGQVERIDTPKGLAQAVVELCRQT